MIDPFWQRLSFFGQLPGSVRFIVLSYGTVIYFYTFGVLTQQVRLNLNKP